MFPISMPKGGDGEEQGDAGSRVREQGVLSRSRIKTHPRLPACSRGDIYWPYGPVNTCVAFLSSTCSSCKWVSKRSPKCLAMPQELAQPLQVSGFKLVLYQSP